ncbi:MAG: DUF2845 domain-containing protein [Spiribacter salinus]|uniref:DUF2845 domain-containing protein n=1 Tax=Spiribacter salinus TaxID=1335746 RepID=A0A540VNM5_9GAMM|nr:MAG: DUF2845 domain-containing protein [Spiribacter salinus]
MDRLIALALLTTTLLAATPAAAENMRCGQDIVGPGDTASKLRDACGDPERSGALVNEYGKRIGTVYYYVPGYGKAERKVHVQGGRVTLVERL